MIKILLLLASIAAGAAAYFGYQNFETYKGVKSAYEEATSAEDDVSGKLKRKNSEMEKLDGLVEGQQEIFNEMAAEEEVVKGHINRLSRENRATEADSLDLQRRVTEIKSVIPADLEGQDPDQFVQQIQASEEDIETKKIEVAELEQLIKAETTAIANTRTVISQKNKDEASRGAEIARNSRSYRVSDVSNEFGFVVINAPRSSGVEVDSNLIVQRAGSRIANLRVKTVEPGQVIANIVDGTLAQGARVLRGDNVIFADLKE